MDGFQAREATMIILDTTVTDRLGFVDSENRCNMACTRVKDALAIVGSRSTMTKSQGTANEEGKQIAPD